MVDRILPRPGARVEFRSSGLTGLGVAAVSVADTYADTYEDTYESAAPMSIQEPEPEAEFPDAVSDLDEDRYDALESPSDRVDDEIYIKAEPQLEQLQPIPEEERRTGGLPDIDSEPIIFSSPRLAEAPAFEQSAAAAYPEETKSDDYKEATDPWDDPLPAWEYSANEYPVLLNEKRSSNWKKIMIPAAAVLFFASVAAGYFLFYQPSAESQEAAVIQAPAQNPLPAPEQSTGAEAAGEQAREPQAEQPQTERPQTEQPAPVPSPEAASIAPADSARPAAGVNEAESSGGAFSLQAASFPDEAAARQFSEHLARGGISARIVAAQLGRRGKWYRVRVGRFASPEEAEKYAAQARARSARLGMNVQLIVCDYEKP